MKRVLVVDDNAMVRRVLKEFLSKKDMTLEKHPATLKRSLHLTSFSRI
jgi:CheY-like chemotaxis protein